MLLEHVRVLVFFDQLSELTVQRGRKNRLDVKFWREFDSNEFEP